MKKYVWLLGFLLLLLLAGCSNQATTEKASVYLIPNGDVTTVVSADGEVVIPATKDRCYILKDCITGAQKYIVVNHGEGKGEIDEYGFPEETIYTSALYDLSGQLVADFQRLSYGETWNDFIMIYQNGEYLIKNMKTGEILQENIDLIQIADHAILVSTDYDQHQYQLYDLNLQPITKFTEYDEVSLYWNKLKERVFIARKGEKYGILNEQGQLILPIEYDQISEISNDYFIVQQGEEYLALDRNQDNTEVFRYPGRISYFDGEIAIAYQETEQDWDNVCMLNAAGDVLLEGYRTLMADSMINQEGGGSKANLFYGEKENEAGKPITQLMNRQGEILQEFDENTYLSIDQDQVLVSQYRFDETTGEDESRAWVMNAAGEEIIPQNVYQSIYQSYGEDGTLQSYYWGIKQTAQGVQLMDLLDEKGNVLISDLKNSSSNYLLGFQCDGSRVVAAKGFSIGLMDLKGNWVYEESIFNGLNQD